jgi:hypothetical protein
LAAIGHTSCGVSRGDTLLWATNFRLKQKLSNTWDLGPRFPAVFKALLKQEVRLKSKATRNINISDALFKYVGTRLFGQMKETTIEHFGEDHVLIGIDPFYGGWNNLYSGFEKPATLDVKSMDSTLCEYVLYLIYSVRADYGFYSDLELKWLWWFYHNTVFSYILMHDGSFYIKRQGMPSGSPMTSRDDSDYSRFMVCYDQAVNNVTYNFQTFGDNLLIDRDIDEFRQTLARGGAEFTDEAGEFLGRHFARVRVGNYDIPSFLPSQFSKHVISLSTSKKDVTKHLSAIRSHADNWALSKKHYNFFKAYYLNVIKQIISENEESLIPGHALRFPSWKECLARHIPTS